MIRSLFFLVPAAVGLGAVAHPVQAGRIDGPTARCEALRNADFSTILDAPTQINEVKPVAKTEKSPGYCQVSGYVAPSVGFALRLPTAEWNGKFIEAGCGGLCGTLSHMASCDEPVRRGYACIVTDGGHQGRGSTWAYNNLQAEIDFAYRATHVTALAGKTIVNHYYRKPPKRSYFEGCSSGGWQALMMAQRFPWDFDGIIAGDPVVSSPALSANRLWAHRALQDERGGALLTQADLELLHRAVMAWCDRNDGIEDGVLGDPRACAFNPAELLCKSAKHAECLTGGQIEAVKKIYSGPTTFRDEPLYLPVAMKGTELNWGHFVHPSVIEPLTKGLRYLYFYPDPDPTWRLEDLNFDRDYRRLDIKGLYSAANPDLRRFKAAGGKLLVYAGWSDTAVPVTASVDYYETVERTMGGARSHTGVLPLIRPTWNESLPGRLRGGLVGCAGSVG